MDELRRLLLAPEQEKLDHIGERLDDPKLHAQDVSRVLPEAILLSAGRDERLANALAPAVAGGIMASIKQDVRAFADALFPVIGPAIRRSINETFKQMLQSLNQTLENSFSWRGLKWRLESWRTGKPFAEVVLLHSLAYRVEQVFLIHRETGILLQHIGIESEAFRDGGLVSGMLTAIQDFVRDSFEVTADQGLDSIQMGDFTIWVEQWPDAVIAAAIRGSAPQRLRLILSGALEDIHLEQGSALRAFDRDVAPFETVRGHLQACLQTAFRAKQRRFSPALALLLVAAVGSACLWAYLSMRDHYRWTDYLQRLKSEPGILVTEAFKEDGVYRVNGLRDPLARDPAAILAGTEIDPRRVVHAFHPYQALSPELILERARMILEPPATVEIGFAEGRLQLRGTAPESWIQAARGLGRVVPGVNRLDASNLQALVDLAVLGAPASVTLTLDDGVLSATGSAPYRWILAARERAMSLPGVSRYDDGQLRIEPDLNALAAPDTVILKLDEGRLTASGSAPRDWILAAREQAPGIPGVAHYDDSGLRDLDLETLMSLKKKLEQELILFGINATGHDEQRIGFTRILGTLGGVIERAGVLGGRAAVQVVGLGFDRRRPAQSWPQPAARRVRS